MSTLALNTLAPACPGFGEVLAKHFMHGTRPDGNTDHPGKMWSVPDFAYAVGCTERAVRHWLSGRHLPGDIRTLERILFGLDYDRYREWRIELRTAHMIALRSARIARLGRRRQKDLPRAA
jgi:hypothetical protein